MAQLGDTIIIGDLTVTGNIYPERPGGLNLNDLLDFFYPVGTYYETSDVNFNPNLNWGEMNTGH